MDWIEAQRLSEQLRGELDSFGIGCSEARSERMVRHLDLVIEKNKVMNLTRITDRRDGVTLHIVDSLLPLAVDGCGLEAGGRFLDIGTGAGFPGIPYGVMTGAQGVLLDSVGKKVRAVEGFLGELGLDGQLVGWHGRVEEPPHEYLHSFDRVLVRAVAPTNVLIEYASPLLRQHGLLIVEKGVPQDDEIATAKRAAVVCGMEPLSLREFGLPRGLGHREILVYEKIRRPQVRLPRAVGEAKRNPLGVV